MLRIREIAKRMAVAALALGQREGDILLWGFMTSPPLKDVPKKRLFYIDLLVFW